MVSINEFIAFKAQFNQDLNQAIKKHDKLYIVEYLNNYKNDTMNCDARLYNFDSVINFSEIESNLKQFEIDYKNNNYMMGF